MSNGLIAKVVETYLIDAMSFTEAEARAIKESEGSRDVQAVSIARSPIKEVVFYGDTDMWHKVKVTYSLMDEATEKEKKVTTYFLVNSADVKEAYERTEEHLKEMLVPFSIPKVEESNIVEVYQYEKQAPKGMLKVENGVGSESEFVKQHGWGASPDGESEEECAMESDLVEAIDPTDGQAVSFEVDPLWDFLANIGFNALPSDLEEIRHMHQDVQLMDFEGWLLQEYLIEGDNARKVSEFLRRKNEAKAKA